MVQGYWKYIDPKTWELVTRVDGVVTHRTSDPKKLAQHSKRFEERRKHGRY